jgi:MFS family permease
LLSRAAPADRQGSFLGLNQSASSLARMSGPPLAGLCFALHPRLPFFLAAGVLLIAFLIARHYHARFAHSFPRAGA